MKVRFWGVRGSLPTPLTAAEISEKLVQALQGAQGVDLGAKEAVQAYVDQLPLITRGTVGGNTPCVEVCTPAQQIILDAGSGLRPLGEAMMAGPCGRGEGQVHLLLSHLHWDHIQGLPYFSPAYVRGNRITIHSAHPGFDRQLVLQQSSPHYPVPLERMGATFEFNLLQPGQRLRLGDCEIDIITQHHPDTSHSCRIGDGRSVVVYATDAEYRDLGQESLQRYVDFFSRADALIFDAQYSVRDALFEKDGWGHSTAFVGIDLAAQAGARRLILFHHEPTYNDQALADLLQTAQVYRDQDPQPVALEIVLAYEGLELVL
ncbi:MAG: MBL fold metallo-hydrolase [Chloroflexota bacterium]